MDNNEKGHPADYNEDEARLAGVNNFLFFTFAIKRSRHQEQLTLIARHSSLYEQRQERRQEVQVVLTILLSPLMSMPPVCE